VLCRGKVEGRGNVEGAGIVCRALGVGGLGLVVAGTRVAAGSNVDAKVRVVWARRVALG
jgi:hypothetical protein